MTQQFHEGQDVEVNIGDAVTFHKWRKAKIVRGPALCAGEFYETTLGVFSAEHIRAARNDKIDPDFKADLALAHDEALEAEGKP